MTVNILLVDDHPANLIALRATLEPLGHRLVEARSGAEAVACVAEEEFAVILLDVRMPDLDGYATAALIKQHARSRYTPVIFISAAVVDSRGMRKAYAGGAVDYVVTPFDPDVLRSKVSVFVELVQLRERVRKQAALEEAASQRSRLHSLFTQLPAIITITRGPDHVYEVLSPLAQRALGDRQVVGRRVADAAPELASNGALEAMDHVFRTGEVFRRTGVKHASDWTGTGVVEERFFNSTIQPLRGRDDEIEGLIAFAYDVTEQVRAHQQAERLAAEAERTSQSKDEFLAAVSHELRNPLNAMLGWLKLLQAGNLPEAKQVRAMETIERNIRTQAQLIEDLLDVSRIASGKLRISMAPLELPNVVAGALEVLRPLANAKGVRLLTTVEPEVATLMGDPERLHQVFVNLVGNALKFTDAGGSVHVRLRGRSSRVEVVVEDTGCGVSPEFLPHVFERFQQERGKAGRPPQGGLGLGLSIVKHIVELHGGTIRCESAGVGLGTTIELHLPTAPARAGEVRSSLSRTGEMACIDTNG